MHETLPYYEGQPLPPITPGEILRSTPNFQITTDYKPGLEGLESGRRFFIEPRTEKGLQALMDASLAHNIFNFNVRPHPFNPPGHDYAIPCLRADYTYENVPVLFHGEVQIPQSGQDTIPSPDRMEECIDQTSKYGFVKYTFTDGQELKISNPQTRHLRLMQSTHLDDIPERVLHSADENSYYKVRKGWWLVVLGRLEMGIKSGELSHPELVGLINAAFERWDTKEFLNAHHLTTSQDIQAINNLIDLVWKFHGNA